jgi:hypothetical protein
MRNNVFAFGSHYFKQCNGTAMGTPYACTYATIYYSYHEETVNSPIARARASARIRAHPQITYQDIESCQPLTQYT